MKPNVIFKVPGPLKKAKFLIAKNQYIEGYKPYIANRQRWILYYLFFGYVWVIQFIFACHRMIVAGAVTIWYFNR